MLRLVCAHGPRPPGLVLYINFLAAYLFLYYLLFLSYILADTHLLLDHRALLYHNLFLNHRHAYFFFAYLGLTSFPAFLYRYSLYVYLLVLIVCSLSSI